MFAAPPCVEAELVARLPENLHGEVHPDWERHNPGSAGMHSFLEGPCIDGAGNLHCVDILNGRIYRVGAAGGFEVMLEYDGEPCGLAWGPDDRFYVADFKHGLLECSHGRMSPIAERARLERFKGVNDLVFSRSGELFFTDQGLTGLQDPSGRVYRRSMDGKLHCLLDNVPSPNGLALSADEKTLYVAATRANAIWRLPLHPDGGVVKAGVHIQLSGGVGPDGLAVDAAGRLYVAHFGLGSVWVFSPAGEPVLRIRVAGGVKTSNVCLQETPDGTTAYVTEAASGSIYRCPIELPPGQSR